MTFGIAPAIDAQLPPGQEFKLVRPPLGNVGPPHGDGLLADPEGIGNRSLGLKMGDCIGLSHDSPSLSMLKRYVNHASTERPILRSPERLCTY